MVCPEDQIIAFLSGDLSEEDERRFDEHLLSCESCWKGVQIDRAARDVIGHLRDSAPPGLSDRVALAVGVAGRATVDRPRRDRPAHRSFVSRARAARRSTVVAATSVAALAAAGIGWLVVGTPSSDPPQVAAVVAMVTPGAAPSSALVDGEHLVIAGQPVSVRAYMIDGKEAIVTTSLRPFEMPVASHLFEGSSTHAWMATDGALALYGVNRSAGGRSMFIVAAMPMAALPQVAVRLHLI